MNTKQQVSDTCCSMFKTPYFANVVGSGCLLAASAVRTLSRYSGDDSTRAPPLPIPNREVKPCNADGTAKAGE